jgi:hypothetical protein
MKKLLIIFATAFLLLNARFCYAGDGSNISPIKLYLGIRGGGGFMLTHNQLSGLTTTEGVQTISTNSYGGSSHVKGELLLGIRRFRIGYRFMYNFSTPTVSTQGYGTLIDVSRNTTYFNGYRNDFFAHYLVLELAVINLRHFGLVPGLAFGSFSGFRVDNDTHSTVWYGDDMHHPFTMGAELNAEIKFGRCAIVVGPNYYLFALQDRTHNDWHQYQHYIGADIGLRVNLLR